MKLARIIVLAIALAGVIPLTACVERVQTRDVVVSHPPPAPMVEEIPTPPGPPEMWAWQPGHWRWDGHDYRWVRGRYVERPRRSAEWVAPHWQQRGGGWIYMSGHWR